jgi:hypothetical protein
LFDEEKALIHGTDEYWVARLSAALVQKYPRLVLLDQWAEGKPPIPKTTKTDSPGMVKMREMSRLNLARQIKGSPLTKLKPQGFKTAEGGDENGDAAADKIWSRNDLKNVIKVVLDWALLYGESYSLVGYEEVDGKREAIVTEESPYEVITIQDPIKKSRAKVALKMYHDDVDGEPTDKIVLYRFDDNGKPYSRVLWHEGETMLPAKDSTEWIISGDWTWDEPEELVTSRLPMQRFSMIDGKGIFEDHLSTMTRINEGIFHRMWIGLTQAQRVMMLIAPEEKVPVGAARTYFEAAQDGLDVNPNTFKADPREDEDDSLFGAIDLTPGSVNELPPGTEIWQGQSMDIRPLLEEVKDDIRFLGEETGTQFAFAISEAVNMSASGANAIKRRGREMAEEIRDVVETQIAELMARAFEIEGDMTRADAGSIEVIWATIDDSSDLEKAEAAEHAAKAGVPWRTRMRKYLQMTPKELAEAESDRMTEMFTQPVAGATTQATPTPAATDVTTTQGVTADGSTPVTTQAAN